MKAYKTNFTNINTNQGFFIINDIYNSPASSITENDFEYFLAEGHETLNIQPPTSEDLKYKTFNGSILFDRSSSKITRIMSNDITGSCLGYLNDLLSANLSRYYFVSNYESFNITTSSNTSIYLTNAKRSNQSVYNDENLYCGGHDVLISSAFDIVKLIGSENVLNNISPSLTTELQQINASPIPYSQITDDTVDLNQSLTPFYYKLFHYYTSANSNNPYIGFSLHDDLTNDATIGGKTLFSISKTNFTQPSAANVWRIQNSLEMNYFITIK